MLRKLQKNIYMKLARHKVFYPLLFKILEKNGYLETEFDKRIRKYVAKNPSLFFVQIGANDGMKFDPTYLYVHKYKWRGILVEPVSYVFDKLKENYKDSDGLIFENVAIGDKEGYKNFYLLKKSDKENLPLWYDEIGSFDKRHILKHAHRIQDIEKHMITEKVAVVTLQALLKKHKVTKIDILQIDTEGYDYHVLKQIPFDKIKPSIIIFEDRHLTEKQKYLCQKLLADNGYITVRGIDCFAYLEEKIN